MTITAFKSITLPRLATTVAALAMALATSFASAANVEVSGVSTADGSEDLFGTNITQAGENGELLTLDINDFIADNTGVGVILPTSVIDTVTMTLTAPEGYLISSLTYNEGGTATTSASAIATVDGAITIGGTPANFNHVYIPPDAGAMVPWSIDPISIAILGGVDSVSVTVTNNLFAFAFEPDATAIIQKTDATLLVGLTPIPIPAAAWLFGSALLGLAGVARRKKA